MKKIANSLMPLAALVLFGTCLVSVFSLLVVLLTSVGFADGVPLFYYQRLNVAVISVALPIVGMIRGSATERVVRNSTCPVLAVPAYARGQASFQESIVWRPAV